MIFLIEYKRSEGRIVSLRRFDVAQRPEAERQRLEKELGLARAGIDNEVVLLEAESEANLRRTHGRYFGDFQRIDDSANGQGG